MKKTISALLVSVMFVAAFINNEIQSSSATTTNIVNRIETPVLQTATALPSATDVIQINEPLQAEKRTAFFESFVQKCKGSGVYASCIYVNDEFAIRLTWGNGEKLSDKMGTARLYDYAWNQGSTVGILAHDYAEGKNISLLTTGERIYLIYTDGTVVTYLVGKVDKWRNTGDWLSFYSEEKDISISTFDLADLYFLGGDDFRKMVLQTCINGRDGVLYVTAVRIDE